LNRNGINIRFGVLGKLRNYNRINFLSGRIQIKSTENLFNHSQMFKNESRNLYPSKINEALLEVFWEFPRKMLDRVSLPLINKDFLTIITNNVYFEGKLYPFRFDTAVSSNKRGKRSWILRNEEKCPEFVDSEYTLNVYSACEVSNIIKLYKF